MRRLDVAIESWPIAGEFRISRGAKTEAVVVVATIVDGAHVGRGECTPYARYGETPEGVRAAMLSIGPRIADGLTRDALIDALSPAPPAMRSTARSSTSRSSRADNRQPRFFMPPFPIVCSRATR